MAGVLEAALIAAWPTTIRSIKIAEALNVVRQNTNIQRSAGGDQETCLNRDTSATDQ
jgi:hypothetical protein